jgi:hypothetical protein
MKEENKHGWFEFKLRLDNLLILASMLAAALTLHTKWVQWGDRLDQNESRIAAQDKAIVTMQETLDRTSMALAKLTIMVDERTRK